MKDLFQTFVKHGLELSFSQDYSVALVRGRYYHAKKKATIKNRIVAYNAFFDDVHSALGHIAPQTNR